MEASKTHLATGEEEWLGLVDEGASEMVDGEGVALVGEEPRSRLLLEGVEHVDEDACGGRRNEKEG